MTPDNCDGSLVWGVSVGLDGEEASDNIGLLLQEGLKPQLGGGKTEQIKTPQQPEDLHHLYHLRHQGEWGETIAGYMGPV